MAKGIDGIFDHLVDEAAFIDRLELGIRAKRRKRMIKLLRIIRTLAIGGKKRIFSTASHGFCTATGNKVQLRFGVMKRFPNVPDFKLIFYANETPITLAQVVLVLNCLFCAGFKVTVSRLELTFDLIGTFVDFFIQRVLSRAKRFRVIRKNGRTTLYVGRPTSGWQLCVYEKTPALTRFEFRLRSAELRRLGVKQASDIIHLRSADLFGRLLSVCETDGSQLPNSPGANDANESRARAIRTWASTLSSRRFYRAMKDSGNWCAGMLRQSAMEKKLRQMQSRLVW